MKRFLIILAIFLGLLALIIYVGVPQAAQRMVLPRINEQLEGSLQVGSVSLDPFTLALELEAIKGHDHTGEPIFALDRVQLDLSGATAFADGYRLDAVRVEGLVLNAVQRPDGRFNFEELLPPTEAVDEELAEEKARPLGPERLVDQLVRVSKEVAALLEPLADTQVRIADLSVRNVDLFYKPAHRDLEGVVLTDLNFEMRDFDSEQQVENSLLLEANAGPSGELRWEGRFSLNPIEYSGTLLLARYDLAEAGALVLVDFPLELSSGSLTVGLTYDAIVPGEGEPRFVLKDGQFEITAFRVREVDADEEWVSFDRLALMDVSGTVPPLEAKAAELLLASPGGRIVREQDGRFDFQRILEQITGSDESEAEEPGPPPNQEPEEEPLPLPKIEIAKVSLTQGSFLFADYAAEPDVVIPVQSLQLTVDGFSTVPGTEATYDLRTQVGAEAVLTASGSLRPYDLEEATTLQYNFAPFDLPEASAYAERYIGHSLQGGALEVDGFYSISAGNLTGNNQVRLKQPVLGPRTNPKPVVDAPVQLGLSLLKDGQGTVSLSLPVSGNLNSPEFQIGGIFNKALTNAVTSPVKAPFKVLGSVLGLGGPVPDHIEFQPGSRALARDQEKVLEVQAQVLGQRPEVALELRGGYYPAADGPALAKMRLSKALAERASGSEPTGSARGQALRELYEAVLGSIPPQDQSTGETETALLEYYQPGDHLRQELVDGRFDAIRQFLVNVHGIEPSRVVPSTRELKTPLDAPDVRFGITLPAPPSE